MFLERIADRLASAALRHSRAILITAGIIGIIALGFAARLRFDPDILNLVPQENEEVNEFRQVLGELGTIDYHLLVLRIPPGRDYTDYEPLVESIGTRLLQSPLITSATWRLPDPLDYLDLVLPHALLFLDPPHLDQVREKLSDEGIRASVAQNRAMLQTPQGSAMEPLVRYDPFRLLPVYLDQFRAAAGGFRIDTASGYYLSEDHRLLLILTKPVRPAQDVPFGRTLVAETSRITSEALAEFRKTAEPGVPLPKIETTGGYAIATTDADLIQKDVIANVLFSFFGVLLLFLYGFRRVASLGYAAIPMALALAVTFGLASIIFGVLSSASAGFAALLAGLGIDFNTVLYGRYVDERNRGAGMAEALRTTLRHTFPSVVIAATTTAATFFAFLMTDFRGMTQMGTLTGIGILLFLVSVAFVLPALIVANEGVTRTRKAPRLFHHSFHSEKLVAFSIRRPRTVIWAWVVFILISLAFATRIRFSDNIQNLRAGGNRGVEIQEELTRTFGQSFNSMMLVFYGETPEEAIEKSYAVLPELDQLVRAKAIASYQSLATFLPPVDRQLQTIATIRGSGAAFDASRIEPAFRAALETEGFRPALYDGYLENFRRALAPERPLQARDILTTDASSLTSRFLHETKDGWMSVVHLYPVGGRWPREVPPPLLELGERHPDAVLTGINLVSGALRRIVRSDATRATAAGTLFVFLLMVVGFRSVRLALLSFVPFATGATGMIGFMAVMGLEFNFMNVFVGLMIVGVATDYAIYMLKRWKEDHDMFTDGGAAETAKSIAMAAITTIVGYGSFAISHYPGLRSIGYASTFGIGLSALSTVTLLPAILYLVRLREGRPPVFPEAD